MREEGGSGIFFTPKKKPKKTLNRYERGLRKLREEGGSGVFFTQHMEKSGKSIDARRQQQVKIQKKKKAANSRFK